MDDGRIWHVRSYPAGRILHTTSTYQDAETWRTNHNPATVIVPEWPALTDGRIRHIREFCAAQISHDALPGGGLTNRAWCAQGVLNILDGNIDDQIRAEHDLPAEQETVTLTQWCRDLHCRREMTVTAPTRAELDANFWTLGWRGGFCPAHAHLNRGRG